MATNSSGTATVRLHEAIVLVERQHALIEELRSSAPRYLSTGRLAQRTGTSERTVARDIARLAAAGVPIDVRHGPGGGYRIDARTTLPPLVLTPGEAAAVISSLVAVGPYVSSAARSVLDKLLAAIAAEPPDRGT